MRAGRSPAQKNLERETGIEPATNSLEGCDSTTELLPPSRRPFSPRRFGAQAHFALTCALFRATAGKPAWRRHYSIATASKPASRVHDTQHDLPAFAWLANPPSRSALRWTSRSSRHQQQVGLPTVARHFRFMRRAEVGGEGRTRTFEATRATDLQSAAFDRSATSPVVCFGVFDFDTCLVRTGRLIAPRRSRVLKRLPTPLESPSGAGGGI